MPLPPEYVELLTAVVECLTSDAEPPLQTAKQITNWLHDVTEGDVREVLSSNRNGLLGNVVRCLLKKTHHPLLSDWTPEQIADWCNRTHLGDIQAGIRARPASNSR